MKIETCVKSSTFSKIPKGIFVEKDEYVTSCYQDENNVTCVFSKVSSCRYVDIMHNNRRFNWSGRALKVGVRECLRMVSEFLMKYDITLLTEENAGENMHIRDGIFELERNIME